MVWQGYCPQGACLYISAKQLFLSDVLPHALEGSLTLHSALHDLQGKVIIESKKDEKLEVPDEATIEDKVRPDP